ncbi:MAG: uroporphyrinogen-III synthase [Coriobacteriales bacterium]|nr:uroporphyrinogen-III synthase [Coriobacteriales bacterium]
MTRSREQAAELATQLEAQGATVIEWPVIRIIEPDDWEPADRAIDALTTYDWIVFTSNNGVERFFGRLDSRGLDARALCGIAIAAVGKGTASRLDRHGIRADYVPAQFVAEGILQGFYERGVGSGTRILIPRALEAREVLPDTLREWGAHVDVAPVYRTVRGEMAPEAARQLADGHVDAVTFTSASTVKNLVALLEESLGSAEDARSALGNAVLASIGPVTSEELRAAGLEATLEADPHSIPGLVEALAAHLGPQK